MKRGERSAGAATAAGIMLGFGLGGFVDGILLHQIMQWHNMGSAILPPVTVEAMQQNMVWDGRFHAATWAVTMVGVFLLHGAARSGHRLPRRAGLVGQMLFGWGAFNVLEGVIDHHLLELHHVRDMPQHIPVYDWLFLGVAGVGLIVTGGWLMKRDARAKVVRG